jgi:CRISPR/Cas system-associated exonuclease Cas4 (RecB family)
MISNSTPIRKVKSIAVWSSDIGEWWFCAHKLMLIDKYGEKETAEMSEGRVRHELQAEEDYVSMILKGFRPRKARIRTVGEMQRLNLRILKSIRDDVVLGDNRSHRFFYGIIIHQPLIVGVPDAIGREKRGWYVVYERKAKIGDRGEPYAGQRMQISAYLMMLEAIGIRKCFGVIHTSDDRKSPDGVRVYLTDEDRRLVKETARKIQLVRLRRMLPVATNNPRKCAKCQMGPNLRNVCEVSAILAA